MVSIVEFVITLIMNIIDKIGYGGIMMLMAIESACIPIPSEVIMPFSGNLAYQGHYNIILVGLVGAIGCLVGSLIAYYFGMYFGRSFVLKYGKYFLLREGSLKKAEWFFNKYGDATAFFSRLLPIVRTFISFPAGIGRMDIKKFVLYTFFGSLPWTFALAYIGYYLGDSWRIIYNYGHYIDAIVIITIIMLIGIYIYKSRRNIKQDKSTEEKGSNSEEINKNN